ncbi:MAG: GntR family transcriptional repressor for pyruvate dehydrogenase complex [Parasphingorhabdus sp.]|jgi:GntR family transcriptional repressor for pyruvate dehydrogenase complex
MKLEPVKPTKVSDSIAEQLRSHILNGVLKPGEKLPAERELVEQLGVSRPSVREALLKLEARGLIESRQGGGTFVKKILTPTFIDPLSDLIKDNPDAISDVLECRHGLEELAASYAALRATENDRRMIRAKFDAVEEANKSRDTVIAAQADVEFHMAIAEASHNVALIHITRSLFDLLGKQMLKNWQQLLTDEESLLEIHNQHQYIFEAIMHGDPDMARNAAHSHLAYIDRSLNEIREAGRRDDRMLRNAV